VLSRLKRGEPSVVVGRTGLPGRTWFARYERNAMDGTEVFANTFALAICRLALLRLAEIEAGSMSAEERLLASSSRLTMLAAIQIGFRQRIGSHFSGHYEH
jgi:hypothetical protein